MMNLVPAAGPWVRSLQKFQEFSGTNLSRLWFVGDKFVLFTANRDMSVFLGNRADVPERTKDKAIWVYS